VDSDGRKIVFGPDANIRSAKFAEVGESQSSGNVEVTTDFDYVDLLHGTGTVEIDGLIHSLVLGQGITVPRGSTYRLHASAETNLAVTIYSVDGE
jgi:mannose-6-phosphate isomerase-like protein (cupin superfamily)